jgi:phage terminase small subunit
MSRRLSPKQKNFSHAFIKTGNATKAVLQTYQTQKRDSASSMGARLMQNPRVLTYIESILDNAGVNDDYLANKLHEIIDNSLSRKALKKITPADGLRGIEMAYRLKDRFPATRTQIDKREVSLKLQGKSPEELLGTLKQIQQDIKTFTQMVNTKSENAQELISNSTSESA